MSATAVGVAGPPTESFDMRVPESWLRAFVNTDLTTDEIAHQLTMTGLEVEEILSKAPPFSGVVVGRILEASRHPDADRLQVCRVDIGAAEPLQIVCGAPNARAGLQVACATDGAVLPGDFKIKKTKMRGVASQGMLCSGKELGIEGDAQGILELSLPDNALGQDIRPLMGLDEKVFVLKLTPNRADCLSILGVARELAAITDSPLLLPTYLQPGAEAAPTVDLSVMCPEPDIHADALAGTVGRSALCGRLAVRAVRGMRTDASTPDWMASRLALAGHSLIHPLVDITNYLMLEIGQPSHAFDLERLRLESGRIRARWAQPGETLTLLDGRAASLQAQMGVVADDQGPVALAGVMGGLDSGVTPTTTDALLEVAFWSPDAIRGRAQALKLSSEAAHRFERGVDPELGDLALSALSTLVHQVCGGVFSSVRVHEGERPARPALQMRLSRCTRVLGRPLGCQQVLALFSRLGLSPRELDSPVGPVIEVQPPSYRFDLTLEEDLIEEAARLIGFNNIPDLPPVAPLRMATADERTRPVWRLKDRLVALDYQEVITYSFISEAEAALAGGQDAGLVLMNPIAEQLSHMRPSLLPSLLKTLSSNVAQRAERVRIFEVGRVFVADAQVADGPSEVAGIRQPMRLGLLAWGPIESAGWASQRRLVDFFDVRQDLDRILPLQSSDAWQVRPAASAAEAAQQALSIFHPGRCAVVSLQGREVGCLGALHPKIVQALGLASAPVLLELDLDPLLSLALPTPRTPPRFPSMQRDLALLMSQQVLAGEVVDLLKRRLASIRNGAWVRDISIFDDYRGQGVPSGQRSLGLRITLQSEEQTLSDDDADGVMSSLAALACEQFSASVRGAS